MNTNQIVRPTLHRNQATDEHASRRSSAHVSTGLSKTMPAELVLIRGLPGSGKTTMASVLNMIGYKHFEADMFFEVDGRYQYDATRIRDAHSWCQKMTREALVRGENVVVSNTFTHLREMQPYLEMVARNIRVIEAKGRWETVHGVPPEMLERMAARWELLPDSMTTNSTRSM